MNCQRRPKKRRFDHRGTNKRERYAKAKMGGCLGCCQQCGRVANPRPAIDIRSLSFRHGARGEFARDDAYLANAVFFDGHAETLASTDFSNPALWLPTGTLITNVNSASGNVANTTVVMHDVVVRYNLGGVGPANPWVSP
jgi:prepilin-type processing-associated H-X9-DG protein